MKSSIGRCILVAAAAVAASAAAAPIDAIRVYAVQPAQFEYVLTAAVGASTTNPLLSFNDSAGRTRFVHVGEALGQYRVRAYEPLTEPATNEHTRAMLQRRSGRATLEGADGRAVVLEMGKPLPAPGWKAILVSLSNATWRTVREGEVLRMDAGDTRIDRVAEGVVTASAGGRTLDLPFATDAEREKVVAMWRQQEEEQNRRLAEAQQKRDDEDRKQQEITLDINRRLPAPRQTVEFTAPAAMSYGTEFRYPTRFIVVPGMQTVDGRVITQPYVVPADFETRSGGTSVISK